MKAGWKRWGNRHFLELAILQSQRSTNAFRVQISLGRIIGRLVLTQQADRSPGCISGQEVDTEIQHQLLALSLGTGRGKRQLLHAKP